MAQVHWHLPDTISRMSPAQLSALTGGSITTDDTPVSSAEESPGCAAVVVLSAEAVAQHASANDCWVIVGDGVYDMTAFLDLHPGGQAVLAGAGGTDATALFMSLHDPEILEEIAAPYRLGALGEQIAVRPACAAHPTPHPTTSQQSPELLVNPKDRYGPEFPKAMRCLAARWEPEGLPVSLSPLSSTPGHTGGTGMTALEPRLWLEHDNVPHQRHPTVSRFVKDLAIKKRLLQPVDNPHYDTVFTAMPDSAPEQEELLQSVLDNLREHHADEYEFGCDSVTVLATGDSYKISDYSGKTDASGTPIAMLLASLLVQEEFFLLRRQGHLRLPRPGMESVQAEAVSDTEPYQYVFIGGTAAINLVHSGIKIHAQVPGMKEQGWHPRLAHIFSGITAEQAFWRSNWSVIEHNLNTHYLHDDDMSYATAEEVAAAYGTAGDVSTTDIVNLWAELFHVESPADMHLISEFQTMHRLPETNALVFTIHKFVDSLSALEQTPEAADMMVRSWEAKSDEQMAYTLGADPEKRRAIIEYVSGIAAKVKKQRTVLHYHEQDQQQQEESRSGQQGGRFDTAKL